MTINRASADTKDGQRDIALRVNEVSKTFGRTTALDGVSFELARGTVHALLGGNGSGKSTLSKILAGVQPADSGTLEIGGEMIDLRHITAAKSYAAGLRFVHQQSSTFSELPVAENLALGRGFETTRTGRISWRRQRRRAAEVLERLQIDVDPGAQVGTLSPANQKMVAIARALQDQEGATGGVLVLDEPTAALPDADVAILLEALRRYSAAGQTIIYVTHRLEEVFAVADSVTLLRDAKLVGSVSPRDLTHDDLVELIMGRSVEQVQRMRGQEFGREILAVEGLVAGPLKSVSLSVRAGEIVGVAGLIGSGRSSLLKSMFGCLDRRAGEVRLDGVAVEVASPSAAMAAGFAYVPEDRAVDAAFSDLSVFDNLSIASLKQYWHRGVLQIRRERREAVDLMSRFLVKAESGDVPLSSLSGGNQQKVILARWLRREPRVLLLDEPTQGVDAGARAEIYELVNRAVRDGAVALVASSDSEELAATCDRVIVLRRGTVIGELAGDQVTSENIQRLAHAEKETVR
jgi:ribose transport system ATP-binding protein